MMAVAVVVAVMVAVWLLVPSPDRTPQRLTGTALKGARSGTRAVVVAPGLLVVVVLGTLLGSALLPWLVVAAALGGTVALLVSRTVEQRRARAMGEQVARGCQVLSGQLRIGQIPTQALGAAAEDCRALERAVAAHHVGGDVAEALRFSADQPGAGGLRSLAAAWQLSERSGAPMAEAADRVARQLSDLAALRRSVAAELAPARATGKLLAGLPLVGLAMGFMVGGSPDEFLVATTVGRWLLAVAVVLACAGLLWTEWLADRVERRAR